MIGSRSLTFVERAGSYGDRIAVVDSAGTHTYAKLLEASRRGAVTLLSGSTDLAAQRVAIMVPPSFEFTVALWSAWRAGAIAVPLCLTHPVRELEYVLETTRPDVVVVSADYLDLIEPIALEMGARILAPSELDAVTDGPLPSVDEGRTALILFTSGTTGLPKGVVSTHFNLRSQMESLVEAWEWSESDRVLLTLPLHHIHGLVNVMGCALWAGASVVAQPRFTVEATTEQISTCESTVYMAVPTVYHRLATWWDGADTEDRTRFRRGCEALRLMVSGSAALPVSLLNKWREISGHTLLERYGMTEIGMALSNSYRGERIPGAVGRPLPGVNVRLVDETDEPVPEAVAGEIQISGPNVFREYWERPEDTAAAFTSDGWFRTGDTAVESDGVFRLLGRNSVDILKSGGEKVSALEIEAALLEHDAVSEVAVVGIDDDEWGQRVVAAVVLTQAVGSSELETWCKARLAPFKVPKQFKIVKELPRNPMGKVVKPDVADLFTDQD